MSSPNKSSLLHLLPKEILVGEILARLPAASLICITLTSRWMLKQTQEIFKKFPRRGNSYWNRFIAISVFRSGDIRFVQWFAAKFRFPLLSSDGTILPKFLPLVAAGGNMNLFCNHASFKQRDPANDEPIWREAVQHGHLQLVQWMTTQMHIPDYGMLELAAEQRHARLLGWMVEHGGFQPLDERVAAAAAFGGDLALLLWVLDHGVSYTDSIALRAAERGHRHILEWTLHNGRTLPERITASAVKSNDIRFVKWIHEDLGCRWHSDTMLALVPPVNMEMLRYLFERGCSWTRGGSCMRPWLGIEVVQYMYDHGCQVPETFCVDAVIPREGDVLHLLKWGHSKGSPLTIGVFCNAVSYCGMDVVKWLHKNKCPWDVDVWECAESRNDKEILQYLRRRGCPTKRPVDLMCCVS